jgi:hypothetical protein
MVLPQQFQLGKNERTGRVQQMAPAIKRRQLIDPSSAWRVETFKAVQRVGNELCTYSIMVSVMRLNRTSGNGSTLASSTH